MDVHADSYVVVRPRDGQNPQPPRKFAPTEFLDRVRQQLPPAVTVHSCYAAGAFGYGLHRQLTALGAHKVVVAPQRLDERHIGVQTDKTDARALALKLDQCVNGNRYALTVVGVPTPAEEQHRAAARQRQQFGCERWRLEAPGRSLLLSQGYRVKGPRWRGKLWQWLNNGMLPGWLLELLTRQQALVVTVHEQLRMLTKFLEATAPTARPKGLGGLTHQLLEREVCDCFRFKNRRQVGSDLGLCPREDSSGGHRRQGAISKHGSPRLRAWLVELAWRPV
jgi:transposase